jgi:C4-dicarboxylate-specific signal transduction histidine kinase
VGCGALVGLIAYVDYITGYELNLSILYLATVCLATWMLGRTAGIAFSLAAVAAWLVVDIFTSHGYTHWFYRYWEMVVRIVTWLGFALLLDRLKTALAHADERFVTVLARLDAAVYVADSESGALLYMNHHCEEAFGQGLANVRDIERRWHAASAADRPPPAGAGGPQQELQDSVSGRWYLLAARAISWIDGRPVGLYIATDVTDRKRAEELARRQQERLEMTSRLTTLGEMASTLAHEINQPLTAIASYCMGCVRRLRSGDWKREELLDALQKCTAQAERAGGIIQRVREYLRKRDPAPVACDVNALIASVTVMMEAEAVRRGARVRLALDPLVPHVLADRIMIEQLLLNLAKNALEAMQATPAGAREVTIRTVPQERNRVGVEVSDCGSGLPPQLRENLFVPFFTTKPEGLGMGLHICRSIVERHGGRLIATPDPAGGTRVSFTLPAACP